MKLNEITNKYAETLTEIDAEISRRIQKVGFKCKKCGVCCVRSIEIPMTLTAEVLYLFQAIHKLEEEKASRLIERARRYRPRQRGCLLLDDDNLCAVYWARPLVCRVTVCKAGFLYLLQGYERRLAQLEIQSRLWLEGAPRNIWDLCDDLWGKHDINDIVLLALKDRL